MAGRKEQGHYCKLMNSKQEDISSTEQAHFAQVHVSCFQIFSDVLIQQACVRECVCACVREHAWLKSMDEDILY